MPDRNGHNRLKRDNLFQLHYFPEIPLEKTRSAPARAKSGNCFKRDTNPAGDGDPAGGGSMSDGRIEAGEGTPMSAADIEKQAYNRGFSKGEKDASAGAAVKLDHALEALNRSIEETRRLKKTLYHNAEKEIIELSLYVARKIIDREVHIDSEVIGGVVRSALAKTNDCESITIRMNPADYQFLESVKERLSAWDDGDRMTIRQDSGIEKGGCLVETDCGDIDARLESRFQVIADALRAKLQP